MVICDPIASVLINSDQLKTNVATAIKHPIRNSIRSCATRYNDDRRMEDNKRISQIPLSVAVK